MRQDHPPFDHKIVLKRVAEGDVTAFRMLFDAYNKRLYAAALKITKSSYGAEEIVQEIFTDLWEGRSNLADVDNPAAYIFTVAYNRTFRYLKKLAADSDMRRSLKYRISDSHNETEEWMEMNETREIIESAVNGLPSQRQLIFKLSRETGLSHKEIAEQLHISPLTVKKQLVLALRNIRSSLARISPLLAFILLHSHF